MKLVATSWLSLLIVAPAIASDPPLLEKADAKRILEFMDWREVTVIAIRQGVDNKGAVPPFTPRSSAWAHFAASTAPSAKRCTR